MSWKTDRLLQYVKERDAAMLSFDLEKIKAWQRKWTAKGMLDPKMLGFADEGIMGGAMKAVLQIQSASAEDKARARQWLAEHGMSEGISC